ncbi:hypothetical protein OF897_18050 [Chryseobacterium formosus]|uniref:Uncharacterized protein n=1 Tax=Chryseobacterium formosus TaxID=1537363 RepID=A0ABT3XW05_9FLAO|nr:hypothetical protein [Chryseobacterium formosus]MCX8525822.1 hypothetical protein [Chryseobacterium formosus]
MTKENLQEIEKYLKTKSLDNAVFIEILDHFVMQISSLMNKEEISFPEAFIQTKINWKSELEMVKADWLSFKKIARIEKSILKRRFEKMTYLSIVISLVGGFAFMYSEDFYWIFQIILLSIYILFSVYNFAFKKMKFSEYRSMSFHPLILRNLLLFLLLIPISFLLDKNIWDSVLNQMILIFGISIQVQLLYYRTKKINILLS